MAMHRPGVRRDSYGRPTRRASRRLSLAQIEGLEPRVVLTTNQGLATQIYIDLLGRQPDAQGLSNATSLLNSGVPASTLATILESSLEYRQDVVNQLYEAYLGRQADPGGLANASAALASGTTDRSLSASLIGSAEFFQASGGTANGFGIALYHDVLGRPIDQGAQASIASQLSAGVTASAIAGGLLSTLEARQDLAEQDYEAFLRRQADPAGLTDAASLLATGPNEALIAALVGSPEYAARIPSAPPAPVLSPGSQGASASVTTSPTPTINGSAEPFSTVVLYDGATVIGSTSAGKAGNWSIATTSLADGVHQITSTGTNALGHTSLPSSPLSLRVSTQATMLVLRGQPTSTTAGQAIGPLTVMVEDPYGDTITTGSPSITVAISTGSGTLLGTKTVTAVGGVATFSDLSIQAAGTSDSLAFSAVGLTGVTTGSFAVDPAAASKLAFATQPSPTQAGQVISPAVVVDVEDTYGNVVTSSAAPVTMAITGSPGTLMGTLTVNAVNGVATFSNLSTTTAGSYTLTATGGLLNSSTSGSFVVTPAPASVLAVLSGPIDGVAGSTLSPVTVAVEDAYGNILTGANDTITAALGSGAGSLLGTLTAPVVNGIATFNNLNLPTAGQHALSFTDGTLGTLTSNLFNIVPAAASQLAMVSQPTNTLLGNLINPVSVAVEDAYGNVVTDANNAVTTNLESGVGTLTGTTTVNPVNGIATFSNLNLSTLGLFNLGFASGPLLGVTSNSFSIL